MATTLARELIINVMVYVCGRGADKTAHARKASKRAAKLTKPEATALLLAALGKIMFVATLNPTQSAWAIPAAPGA